MVLKFLPRGQKQNLPLLPNKLRHDSAEDHSGGPMSSLSFLTKHTPVRGYLPGRGVNDPLPKRPHLDSLYPAGMRASPVAR